MEVEEYDEYLESPRDKGKYSKNHRPKSSGSRSSHSSTSTTGVNELPPIHEPELPPPCDRDTPRRENSDCVIDVASEDDGESTRSGENSSLSRMSGDTVSRASDNSLIPRSRMSATSPRQEPKSFWSRLKKGFGKNKSEDRTSQIQPSPRHNIVPGIYNQDAQDRRMRIVMQMMKKTDELAEKEYDRFQELKERERLMRESHDSRLEERLFKQVARGQVVCNQHEKTLHSLNHLLKLERKHDDSMITSICDLVLQKPEMRQDLMRYVRQEHEVVTKTLGDAAKNNPATDIKSLQKAVSEIHGNHTPRFQQQPKIENSREKKKPESPVSTEPVPKKTTESPSGDTKKFDEKADRKHLRRRRTKSKIQEDNNLPIDTKAKAPAYPMAENMINARDGNENIPSTAAIQDEELANYVKTLESTVDDKLRVLLDTHSNRTESKMAEDMDAKPGAKSKRRASKLKKAQSKKG